MSYESEIFLHGQLNTDDEDRDIPNGHVRDARYLRPGTVESASDGTRTSFKGNELVGPPTGFLPPGENTVIGMCKYIERKSIIIFYHNGDNEHSIVLFETLTGNFYMVLQSPVLMFQLDYPIIDAKITDDLLTWTDRKENPLFFSGEVVANPLDESRLFNGMMRINMTTGIAGGYTTIDLRSIEALKWPPWYAPTVYYGSEDGKPNLLVQKYFKFRYQFGYADGEWSAWSPISDLPLPTNEEWVQGPDYANPFVDNKIVVRVETGNYRVTKMRFAVSVNDGFFNLYHEVDKAIEGIGNNTVWAYDFFNNYTLSPISTEVDGVVANNDNMPQVVGALELLPTNQIAVGDLWEGYNNVAADYQLFYICHEIQNFIPAVRDYQVLGANDVPVAVSGRITLGFVDDTYFGLSAGDNFVVNAVVTAPSDVGSILLTYALTQADIDAALLLGTTVLQLEYIIGVVLAAWIAQIEARHGSAFLSIAPATGTADSIEATNSGVQPFLVSPFNFNVTNPLFTKRKNGLKRALKRGWNYYVALQWYDRGLNDGTVQKQSEAQLLQVAFPSEEAARDAFTNPANPYYVTLLMLINNLPPIWADSYKVVIRKVRADFMQTSVAQILTDPANPETYRLTLDTYYHDAFGALRPHEIKVGDMVRFVNQSNGTNLDGPAGYVEDYNQFQVVKFDPAGGDAARPAIWISQFDLGLIGFPSVGATGYASQLIEIITPPKLEDNSVWFEIYDGKIGLAHTLDAYHKGTFTEGGAVVNSTANFFWYMDGDITSQLAVGDDFQVIADGVIYEGEVLTIQYFSGPNQTRVRPVIGSMVPSSGLTGTWGYRQNQVVTAGVSVTPATVEPGWGDIYVAQEQLTTGFAIGDPQFAYYWVERPNISAFCKSDYYSIGRPARENVNNERTNRKGDVLHSGAYFDNTENNNLSDFTGLKNRKSLNEANGRIMRMKAYNKALHVIQEIATTPIYNGTYGVGADGEVAQTAFINTVFADIGREIPFGTVHRTSVQSKGGNIYFYDYNRSVVVKLTDGGYFDICTGEYKTSKYFFDITNLIRPDFFDFTIFSVLDELNSEYILNFLGKESNEAMVFNYKYNRWTHKVDYEIIWGENMMAYLLTSNGTNLYHHNAGNELEFYGVVRQPSLSFLLNKDPELIKKPLTIGLKTNSEWAATEILVNPSINFPEGMISEIPAGEFEAKEEYLWAAYLNDKSNIVPEIPDLVDAEHALISGRNLIGSSAKHKIVAILGDYPVVIRSVKITYDLQHAIK